MRIAPAILLLTLPLGCTLPQSYTTSPEPVSTRELGQAFRPVGPAAQATQRPVAVAPSAVQLVQHTTPKATLPDAGQPSLRQTETLPIDLPTVIRLVDANSPAIGFAQAKMSEAHARLDQAELQWIPTLSVGTAYNRFDGQTQNQSGSVFGLSRGNLFTGGGAGLNVDVADAVFRPLIERRLTSAEQHRLQATILSVELEAVSAYLDLIQLHALMEISKDTLEKSDAMLKAAENAREAKLDRTAGDVQRAQTELYLRQAERAELEGRLGAASARLARLLQLQPSVKLVPLDMAIAPITLVDPNTNLDQLVQVALQQRPDLAAYREVIAAAWTRVRRQERGVLYPKVAIANQTGSFGGGLNGNLQDFSARNALSLQLSWELKNLGFGNRAEANERRAQLSQTHFQLADSQARAMEEIIEAAYTATARYEAMTLSQKALKEASELYRITKEGTFNVVDAKNLFDALRPLQAIQALNQSQRQYLGAVLDYNRAQYRLFTLLGQPTRVAIPNK